MREIKLIIIELLILIPAAMLFAQPAQANTLATDQVASMIRDALDLSYSQTIHIQDILTEISGQIELTKPDCLTDPKIARDNTDDFHWAADDKIKSVLNEPQKSKYDQIKGSLFKTALKHSRPKQM